MSTTARLALAVAALTAPACGYPAFTSSMRTSGFAPEVPLEATCVRTGRGAEEVDAKVREMYRQGFRLVYVSEYTSTARPGFPTNLCFERPAGGAPAPAVR